MLGDAAIYQTLKPKLNFGWWVLCRIEIYDTVTKKIGIQTMEELLHKYNPDFPGLENEPQWSNFMWSEGNWSCDCNRHLFWGRSLGISEELLLKENTCGKTRFIIKEIVRLDTGEKVYSEMINGDTTSDGFRTD